MSGVPLAAAFVRIRPDGSGFKDEAGKIIGGVDGTAPGGSVGRSFARGMVGATRAGLGSLSGLIGGEVGELVGRVSAGFDQLGEHSKGMAPKITAGGAAMVGLGGALTMLGSKNVDAQHQLEAAVTATGKGYEDFNEDVENAVKGQVKFGHSDTDVRGALQRLTQAYGDPKKALAEMSVTTDLAAAKHISLSAAAGLVAKIHGGAGKVLKEFGINIKAMSDPVKNLAGAQKAVAASAKDMDAAQTASKKAVDGLHTAQQSLSELEARDRGKKKLSVADQQALAHAHDKVRAAQDLVKLSASKLATAHATLTTKQKALAVAQKASTTGMTAGDEALTKLSGKLKGQGSASMDSFGGKVRQVKTWLTDQASEIGEKYGPSIAMAGGVVTALGTVMQVMAARQAAAAVATDLGTAAASRQTFVSKIAAAGQWLWNAALTANPIGLVIVGIAALAAGLIYAYQHSETFRDIVNGVFHAVQVIVGNVIGAILGAWASVTGFVSGVWASITGFVGQVVAIGATIFNALTYPYRIGAAIVIGIFLLLQTGIMGAVNALVGAVVGGWNAMWAMVAPIVNGIKGFVIGVWNGIFAAVSGVVGRIWAVVSGAFNLVSGVVRSVMGTVSGVISTAWNTIWGIISGIAGRISGVVSGAFNGIKDAIGGALGGAIGAASTLIGKVVDAIKGGLGKIASIGGDIVSGLIDGLTGSAGRLWNAITEFIKKNVPDPVRKVLGIASRSKVFYGYGQETVNGMIAGVDDKAGALESVMSGLVKIPNVGALSLPAHALSSSATARGAAADAGGGGSADLLAEVQGLRADIRALPRNYQMGQRQMAGA